ncbi:MAG: 5-(carboxyamino)imidazole ribonucleotide mutase [Candidatus Thermoplasmatota archaeon]|nr:5-(carboxyamino)imidazole ribonucleotide mutase [Candidatus Thermoplasmatota archaeon]
MRVAIIAGSRSDESVVEKAKQMLERFDIEHSVDFISAHRSHNKLEERIKELEDVEVFIAIAGLSAALPGFIASLTEKPVIGVPVSGKLSLDSILSMVQMPSGVPVATMGLDRGDNAAIFAAEILSLKYPAVKEKLLEYKVG